MHVSMYACSRAREHPISGNSLPAPALRGAPLFAVATAPRSPAWHRRRRALRSRARTKHRLGIRLSPRQLRLLVAHHSTSPALRSAVWSLMGRGEAWSQEGDAWHSSAGSYQLWRGVKPAGRNGQVPWKPKGPKAPEKPRFPAYDAPALPAKGSGKSGQGAKGSDTQEVDEGMVSQVQKALNFTRKAEVRLSRLIRDREKAETQWQAYAIAARDAFYRERERENDMRKHSRVSTATSRRRRPCSPRPGGPCETRS